MEVLTSVTSVFGTGWGLPVRNEARNGKDLLPRIINFEGAGGAGGELRAKLILLPIGVGEAQMGWVSVMAVLQALGWCKSWLVALPVLSRCKGAESPNTAVVQHTDRGAVEVRGCKLGVKVKQGRRKVTVCKRSRHPALPVIHGGKSIWAIGKGNVHVLICWHGDPKRPWLLAGNRSITAGFSSGGKNHQCWGGQRVGEIGWVLHLERCPV